jgi:hypothetical protein
VIGPRRRRAPTAQTLLHSIVHILLYWQHHPVAIECGKSPAAAAVGAPKCHSARRVTKVQIGIVREQSAFIYPAIHLARSALDKGQERARRVNS